MSIAQASTKIKFNKRLGTFTVTIVSPSGDLFQNYQDNVNGKAVGVGPDFTKTKPRLNLYVTSSRKAEGISTPDAVVYYFNGTKIDFSAGTTSSNFDGAFEKIAPDSESGELYYGLRIVKNLVELSNFTSAVIRMEAVMSSGKQTDTIGASFTIPITKGNSESGFRATIASPSDTSAFIITEKGGTAVLRADFYLNGTEYTDTVSGKLSYQWYKMSGGAWVAIIGATSRTYTVKEEDVHSYGMYRVAITYNSVAYYDQQGVTDASDPWTINLHPNPADETIDEDDSTRQSVTYTPKVASSDGTETDLYKNFYFTVTDATGVILNNNSSDADYCKKALTTFTVTMKYMQAQYNDVSLDVETVD